MNRTTLAIVGAGASGTLAAIHLLRGAQRPVRILMIDRQSAPGVGAAYSTTDPLHLLNVRAGNMSAFPAAPADFVDWAHADPAEFRPRLEYAQYLAARLRSAQSDAARGVHFEFRNAAAVDISNDASSLRLANGDVLDADRTVLALGNLPPRPLPIADPEQRIRHNPWTPAALDGLAPTADVLLVGTGLTMVDVVVSLLQTRGHRGKIYAISRRGQLPHVHVLSGPAPLPSSAPAPMTMRELVRWVRRAAREQPDWRAPIDGLRPVTQTVWQELSLEERARFLRHVQPYWDTHRHRIAPAVGLVIENARRSGQLQVTAGRLVDLNGTRARIQVRHGGVLSFDVERVINCTGPATSFEGLDEPLIQRLLARGLASHEPLRLGFSTGEDGRLLDASGQPSSRIFTLGPMRRGALWETVAVPDIRVQAANLANVLVTELALAIEPSQVASAGGC